MHSPNVDNPSYGKGYENGYADGYANGYDRGYLIATLDMRESFEADNKQMRDCLRAILDRGEAPKPDE